MNEMTDKDSSKSALKRFISGMMCGIGFHKFEAKKTGRVHFLTPDTFTPQYELRCKNCNKVKYRGGDLHAY